MVNKYVAKMPYVLCKYNQTRSIRQLLVYQLSLTIRFLSIAACTLLHGVVAAHPRWIKLINTPTRVVVTA
jgi:hypothetical protein